MFEASSSFKRVLQGGNMGDDHHKRIACIFEEEQVFLTKNGCFYGYKVIDGTFKCRRLNTLEINRFLYRIKDDKNMMIMSSGRQVRKPLPRKYEDAASQGI